MTSAGSGNQATLAEQSDALAEVIRRVSAGYSTVGAMAYHVLRDAIESGVFAPGEWLRQETLAEAIGVSRVPVRTALIQLESEGLVVFHARRGAQVRDMTVEQVREAYELRRLFEPHALRKSMGTMTPQRLQRLQELADQLDALEEGPRFVEARVEFYRELYDAERNPTLTKLIEDLRHSVGRYLLGKRIAGHTEHLHRHLVERVASGDIEAAVGTLTEHLDKVRAGVEQVVAARAASTTEPVD
jgi:DNA-binding GntR family transcriptional regulator